MAQRDCKYICKIEDIFYKKRTSDDHNYFYIIMELCTGGELFEAIVGEKCRHFNERDVAIVMRQVVEAVNHLHLKLGIAHRDLKPENILLTSSDVSRPPEIRLTDFGFARQSRNVHNRPALKTPVYTPYYVDPGIVAILDNKDEAAKYNESCDIWSLGVILYIMLVGRPPFFSTTGKNTLTPGMKKNISLGHYQKEDINFGEQSG